jgi:ribosomal protein S21
LIRVKVRMNESLDQLLKRFKKACEKRRRQERQLIRKMQKEAGIR